MVERLRSVLPAPRPYARGARTPLRGAASPAQLAAEMRRLPGFAWLDGGANKLASHRLSARPLAVTPLKNGPLQVRGNLEVCAGTGRTVARITEARLCRCGQSKNKPFCDLSHLAAGFVADGAAS